MSLGVFQRNGNDSRKILIFAALTFISLIFRYEFLYVKYLDLLDKLKEVKKSPFFRPTKPTKFLIRLTESNLFYKPFWFSDFGYILSFDSLILAGS
jgi:uncharacterized protein YlbG (UPF0298 family)